MASTREAREKRTEDGYCVWWPKRGPFIAAASAFVFLCGDLLLGVRPDAIGGVNLKAFDNSDYRVLLCAALLGTSIWFLTSYLDAQRDQRAERPRRKPTIHYDSAWAASAARGFARALPLVFLIVAMPASVYFSFRHLPVVWSHAEQRLAGEMSAPEAGDEEIVTGTIGPAHTDGPLAAPPVAPLLPRGGGENPGVRKDPIANEVTPPSPTVLPPLTVEVPAAAKPARARAQQQKKSKAEPDTIEGWFRWIVAWLDANSKPLPSPGSDGR